MADSNDHLKLWNTVCVTDPKYVEKMDFGAKLSAIDATYQKHRATSLFGAYGQGWGLKNLRWGEIKSTDGLPAEITLEATFWWPDGEFEISSEIEWKRGADCRKKLQTELWKKALSYLGFSADVYLGKFDDEKYGAKPHEGTDAGRETCAKIIQAMEAVDNTETLDRYMEAAKTRGLGRYWMSQVTEAYNRKSSKLQQSAVFGDGKVDSPGEPRFVPDLQ